MYPSALIYRIRHAVKVGETFPLNEGFKMKTAERRHLPTDSVGRREIKSAWSFSQPIEEHMATFLSIEHNRRARKRKKRTESHMFRMFTFCAKRTFTRDSNCEGGWDEDDDCGVSFAARLDLIYAEVSRSVRQFCYMTKLSFVISF